MSNPLIGTTLAGIDAVAIVATIVWFQKKVAGLEERLKKYEEAFDTHTKQVKSTFVNVGKDIDECKTVSKSYQSNHDSTTRKLRKLSKTVDRRDCEIGVILKSITPKTISKDECESDPIPVKGRKGSDSNVSSTKPAAPTVKDSRRCAQDTKKSSKPVRKAVSDSESDTDDDTGGEDEDEEEVKPVKPPSVTSSNRQPPGKAGDADVSAVIAAASAGRKSQ
jgi:hypothetical protein